MTINGENVTPPMSTDLNVPSCLVCFQYRVHENETDQEARLRVLNTWIKQDELLHKNQKHFVRLEYHDLHSCDSPDKSITYKKKEDFPLTDVPVPGCRNVWFVKWEKLPK